MDYKKMYRFKLYLHRPGMKPVPYWISNTGDLIQEDEFSTRTLFWGTAEQARVAQAERLSAHGDFLEGTNLELFFEVIDQKNIPEKILKKLKGADIWRNRTTG